MTVLSVADKIDDNIRAELSAPISGKLADVVDSLNIIGIDVEDWGINSLGNIGTVCGGAGETRISGETNLVVHNEMDGATSGVGRKRVEAKAFVHNTLSSEGSVTVEKNTHGGSVVLLIVVVVLDGAGLSEDDGVLSLQMRRVGNERKLDTLSGGGWALKVHSQMVFDISGSLILTSGGSTEFAENRLIRLADNVGEDVQAATMGHTNDNVLDTIVDTAIDESLHSGNEGLATFQTETLVVGVFCGGESFKAGRPNKAVQDTALLVDGVFVWLWDFDTLSEPVALFPVWDVNVFDTV